MLQVKKIIIYQYEILILLIDYLITKKSIKNENKKKFNNKWNNYLNQKFILKNIKKINHLIYNSNKLVIEIILLIHILLKI